MFAPFEPFSQLSLFPFGPFPASGPVAVFHRPGPGIARAVFAPLILDRDVPADKDELVHFFAVGDDGLTVANSDISYAQLDATLLSRLQDALRAEREACPNPSNGTANPSDSLANLMSPVGWRLDVTEKTQVHRTVTALVRGHVQRIAEVFDFPSAINILAIEEEVSLALKHQISNAVGWALQALDPAAHALMLDRPQIGLALIRSVIELARTHGAAAEKFAWQALGTESLGSLHLISSGQPADVASCVRAAIFSGRSLPEALKKVGVGRREHRLSLRKNHGHGTGENSLSELQLSGARWLTLQHLLPMWPVSKLPTTAADWAQLAALSDTLNRTRHDERHLLDAMCWSWAPGQNSSHRMDRLLNGVFYFNEVAKRVSDTNCPPSFDKVLGVLMRTLPNAAKLSDKKFDETFGFSIGQMACAVAGLTQTELGAITHGLWSKLPKYLPDVTEGPYRFRLLYSLAETLSHGEELAVCLHNADKVLDYCCRVVLFKISTEGDVVGTLALSLGGSTDSSGLDVAIHTISGFENLAPNPDMIRAAQSYAATLKYFAPSVWRPHIDSCAEFRVKISGVDTTT